MLDRRIFFKQAGLFTLGTVLLPGCNTSEKQGDQGIPTVRQEPAEPNASGGGIGPIGLQLYSVKDVIEDDLKGTLQQLADMGYKEVEAYPGKQGHYFGMEPKAFASMLENMGLTLVSSHFGSGSRNQTVNSWQQATMLSRFEELAEKAAQTGQQYLTCSSLDQSLRNTKEDLKKTADLFNKTGETCKKAGLQFAYHNHAFEFEKVGDVVLYDYMLENTDPELVKWELDMYWVVAGGKDPIAYLEKYPDRFPLGHVKDMDKQDKEKNAILGQGAIDYAKILKVAQKAGMKHFLVEQESFNAPVMEEMKENYTYLSNVSV